MKARLQEECGVTEISTWNSNILLRVHGKPSLLVLRKDKGNRQVVAYWGNACREPFTFTGFGFGYSGSGPHGLLAFLQACGKKVDIGYVSGIMDEHLPKTIEL